MEYGFKSQTVTTNFRRVFFLYTFTEHLNSLPVFFCKFSVIEDVDSWALGDKPTGSYTDSNIVNATASSSKSM